jgi:hypothetical protein
MRKSLIVLAILSTMSAPALAQNNTDSSQQPAKPQMVKKRVCENIDENPYSRLGNRKICRTIEVPAQNGGDQAQQSPTSADPKGK